MKFTSLQRTFLVSALLVLGIPSSAVALQFDDTDIFPFFKDIIFSQTAIGFPASRHYKQALKLDHFVLNRDTGAFLETDSQTFGQAFPDWQKQIERTAQKHGFTTKDAYCAEGRSGHHEKLIRNGKVIPVPIGLCSSISVLRVIGDQVWLGTLTKSEGARYAAEGVVVLSLEDGSRLKTVNLPGAVSTLRADPYSGNIWVATQRGIFEIDRQVNLVSEYHFYHEFDRETGEPRLLLASSKKATNPLVVVAHTLGLDKDEQKSFYQAVKTIPESVVYGFSLYGYFMGHTGQPFYPKEMNVLVPFIIKAARSAPPLWKRVRYVTVCRFDDNRAVDFFLKESKQHDRQSSGIVLSCLRKYGYTEEVERAKLRHVEIQKQRRKEAAARQFASLTKAYFVDFRMENSSHAMRTMEGMCRLLREHPQYIESFVALFIERDLNIPRDINFFAHCIRQNVDRPGFDRFLPILIKGLRVGDANMLLYSACEALTSIPTDQLSGAMMPVLRARATAASYKKQYDSAAINPFIEIYESCANASRWVLDHKERIDLLLIELKSYHDPEIQSAAFDTLNEITGVDLRSVDEWKEWWEENRELRLWLDAYGVQ